MKHIRYVTTSSGDYFIYDLDPDERGKRRRLYAKTKEELLQKIEKAEGAKQKKLESIKPKSKNLLEYVKYSLEHYKPRSGRTSKDVIGRIKFILERTIQGGRLDKNIDTIKTEDIIDFVDYLSERYYVANIKEFVDTLEKAFAFAAADGISVNVDFSKIKAPDASSDRNPRGYIPTPEELEKLIAHCIDDNCAIFGNNERVIILCMLTGQLPSAVINLKYKDIDIEHGVLKLSDGECAITERMSEWLIECIGTDGAEPQSDEFFFHNKDGKRIDPRLVQGTLVKIVKNYGFPKGITNKSLQQAHTLSEFFKNTKGKTASQKLVYKSVPTIFQLKRKYEECQEFFAKY